MSYRRWGYYSTFIAPIERLPVSLAVFTGAYTRFIFQYYPMDAVPPQLCNGVLLFLMPFSS